MPIEVIFPRVDMDMSEGKIAHWYVKEGDQVSKGQVVFEIETDKATMEIDAAADGIIAGISGAVGVTMPVGQTVAWILQPGEALPGAVAPAVTPLAAAPVAEAGVTVDPVPAAAPAVVASTGLLRATPLARSLARERGVALAGIAGSGPDGRVLAADLPAAAVATTAGALHLHWFSRREGAPLVLLHGFGTASGSWRPLADELRDLPLLGIDLPNHGKSPRAAVPDVVNLATRLLERLDAEGINELHLAGHSLGGAAALALAPLLGQRLRSLTLIAPAGLGPEINGAFIDGILRASRAESLRPWLALLFADPARLSGSFVATALQELGADDKRDGLRALAASLLPDGTQATSLRDRLDALDVPVKVIWGDADRILPPGHANGLPGQVALHRVAAGHLPQIETSALVAKLLRQQFAAAAPTIAS